MEDFMIIELYFARDEQAIKETDRKYGKLCFRIANNILSNHEDAEECVNDTYWSAWNAIPPTRPNNFMAFLCKIARNLSLKKLECKLALKRSPDALVSFHELEEVLSDDHINPNTGDDEIRRILISFLQNEKEASRNVFIRRYYFLILSVTLQGDILLQKAKLRICYITPGTD